MKPNDFKLNTDYLTIANVENLEVTALIPPGVIPAGTNGEYTYNLDIKCKPSSMTMVRMCLHHDKWSDSSIWGVGSVGATSWSEGGNSFVEEMSVSAYKDDTIRFTTIVSSANQPAQSNITVPAHTIKLRLARFKIPNVL